MVGLSSDPRTWLRLMWPAETTCPQIEAALMALNGLSTPARRDVHVLQTTATSAGIDHRLAVPTTQVQAITLQLRQAIPGLGVEPLNGEPILDLDLAWRVWLSTNRRPLLTDHLDVTANALLAALGAVGDGEMLLVQWQLGPVRRPLAVPPAPNSEVVLALRAAVGLSPAKPNLDADALKALTTKQALPGWRALGQLAVHASGIRRQRQLLGRLSSALRIAQAPGVQLGVRRTSSRRLTSQSRRLWWPLALNVRELTGLIAWPIGETAAFPVRRLAARPLPPHRSVPSRGRVVGRATFPGQERDLALPATPSHLLVVGPTGVGKSTLLLNLIVQDMAAGRGLCVIEPKGDLIESVLERVPAHRIDDVVVLDPTDNHQPVGLNPFAGQRSAELVADHVLAVFRRLYAGSWGPRLQEILHAGLLTIAAVPGATLCHLPSLYLDAGYRRRVTATVQGDLALAPFWAWFEGLSDGERFTVLAPVLNKVRGLLLRPSLRGVIGQAEPRFQLAQVFTERKVLLVNLAKGSLGSEGAQLFGGLVFAQLWQTIQTRSTIPADRRRPVFVYADEFADFIALPTDMGEVLAQSRGLGAGLTLAHQHLAQLPPELRASVLANARSRIVFQTTHDDAAVLTRSRPELTPEDVTGLGAYEVYVQLLAGGQVTPYASARTQTDPAVTSDPVRLRSLSRDRYGVDRRVIEAQLAEIGQPRPVVSGPLGRRRRSSNGAGEVES